jgi:hypothetical protein
MALNYSPEVARVFQTVTMSHNVDTQAQASGLVQHNTRPSPWQLAATHYRTLVDSVYQSIMGYAIWAGMLSLLVILAWPRLTPGPWAVAASIFAICLFCRMGALAYAFCLNQLPWTPTTSAPVVLQLLEENPVTQNLWPSR